MRSEFDGHTKTGTFSRLDRVPKGRKPVSSKWRVLVIRRARKEK